jgi:hypothetical protein
VHINDNVTAALAAGEPVISVDTKKKEASSLFRVGSNDGGRRPIDVSWFG